MKPGTKIFSALVIMVFLLSSTLGSKTRECDCPPEKKARAKELYEKADTIKARKFTPETVKSGIGDLKEAVELCPCHTPLWVLLSNYYWQLGDWLPDDMEDEKRAWFEKGLAAGEKALSQAPEEPGAIFFKTLNEAAIADIKGWASSLWMFPDLLKAMDKVDAIDPHYEHGATDRFWSEVLCRVPFWLAGRFGFTVDEVVSDLKEEVRREPDFFENHTYLARILWKQGKEYEALSRLKYVIEHDPDSLPAYAGQNRRQQKKARKMWKEFTGKNYPNR